jgi:hypothetical protein
MRDANLKRRSFIGWISAAGAASALPAQAATDPHALALQKLPTPIDGAIPVVFNDIDLTQMTSDSATKGAFRSCLAEMVRQHNLMLQVMERKGLLQVIVREESSDA